VADWINMKTQFAILSLALVPAIASANTAVSEANGKLDSAYAQFDSIDAWVNSGSFSNPIADAFGIQLDGLYADTEDDNYAGAAAHVFWRDSEVALLGLTAGGVWSDDADAYEIGAEAECYKYDWVTLGARAGYCSVDSSTPVFFGDPEDDGLYALIYATFYPAKDLAVTLSAEHRYDEAALGLGLEYALPVDGLSAFTKIQIAEDDHDYAMIGLRYYFGSGKPLIERHRRDDPPNILQGILSSMQSEPSGKGDQ
jgi:hypothetical protein